MIIEQLYTNCLAQAAYYIESDGEAVVIDPLRDIQVYIDMAGKNDAKIRCIFETHFHADFVSGHLDLARATGAAIVFGPTAQPGFEAVIAKDGEVFTVGDISFKVLHTPGHTMESCCYLLRDEKENPVALFSGDTLFLGDVGRPDLAQEAARMTKEELAGLLYESIQNKILPLPDSLIIYPGHGAGSACGKNMSADKQDTLGHQKITNYALRKGITKDEFVKEVTAGLPRPPQYFPSDAFMNKKGYVTIEEVIARGTRPLPVNDFEQIYEKEKALILDTRQADIFTLGFIPGSINIGVNGDFAPWVGTLIADTGRPVLIVCDEDRAEEVVIRLSRVGYDNSLGYLDGGIEAWRASGRPIDKITSITAEELADRLDDNGGGVLLDVRRESEFDAAHVTGAINMPLNNINTYLLALHKDDTYYVYCAAGYRSMIFTSITRTKGFRNFINVSGGFKAIKENGRLFLSSINNSMSAS